MGGGSGSAVQGGEIVLRGVWGVVVMSGGGGGVVMSTPLPDRTAPPLL